MNVFACPHCGKQVQAAAGQQGKCPHCGGQFVVPSTAAKRSISQLVGDLIFGSFVAILVLIGVYLLMKTGGLAGEGWFCLVVLLVILRRLD